jgi:hypothetical protein
MIPLLIPQYTGKAKGEKKKKEALYRGNRAMLRHIWYIFAQAGSIWVAWVKENWIKGRSFWQLSTPKAASYSWKQLLKLRNIARDFLSFKVGDGRSIFLWLDKWHPNSCLLDKYGHRAVRDVGSTIGAKL